MLTTYDVVIYGGGLYAVGINGVKLITQNLHKLEGKKVVVFATGASPFREEAINKVRNRNFTYEQQKHIRFFYLRGGFDYSKLKPFYKVLMTLLKWKLKRKKELTPDQTGMLTAYDKPADFTRKKNIDELITYVTSINHRNIKFPTIEMVLSMPMVIGELALAFWLLIKGGKRPTRE